MSIEEKYFIGLEDLRLHFECKECGTRISMTAKEWKFPYECLKCNTPWFSRDQRVMGEESQARAALFSLVNVTELLGNRGFTLSFEVKK